MGQGISGFAAHYPLIRCVSVDTGLKKQILISISAKVARSGDGPESLAFSGS